MLSGRCGLIDMVLLIVARHPGKRLCVTPPPQLKKYFYWGTVDIHYFLGLQNHCRWWLQPWNEKTLAPWKINYDQPRQHIKKQRHYFADKDPSSHSYGVSSSHVWMCELDHKESWVLKNWCFWTVVLEKTPWTARRSNQSVVKEISPEYLLEGLMLKLNSNSLATCCKELTHWKRPWCWGRLKVGERENRGWDGWMASPTWRTWVWVNSASWWWTGRPGVLQSMESQKIRHDWVTELN